MKPIENGGYLSKIGLIGMIDKRESRGNQEIQQKKAKVKLPTFALLMESNDWVIE
jgi:hypothetical protein